MKAKVEDIGSESISISEISIAELKFGAYKSGRLKHLQEVHRLENLVTILPIHPVLDLYAREKARLSSLGKVIPDFDLLIGCTAVHHNLTLVTGNTKHHRRIQGITTQDWTYRTS